MARFTVYVDESGNSGSNFLDHEQPIFTLVGLGIDHEKMVPILLKVEKLKKDYGINSNQTLHAKNLRKFRRINLASELLNLSLDYTLGLFLIIVEKQFTIATYIDNEFLEPGFNDKCDDRWIHPLSGKNERANFFYNNLSQEAFEVCGRAFKTGEDFRKAYELIRRDIKEKSFKNDLYNTLEGVEPNLSKLSNVIASINSKNEKIYSVSGVAKSPNLSSFISLLNKIELYYSLFEGSEVELVFDSSRQYDKAFEFWFNGLRDAKKNSINFTGRLPIRFGYDYLKKFRTESSTNSVFLQMTDILATSIKDVVQKILKDDGREKYSEAEYNLLFFINQHLLSFEGQFCTYIVPDKLLEKFAKTQMDTARVILKNKFRDS